MIVGTGIVVPLACFALVVLVMGITQFAKIHEMETEVAQRIHMEQAEHRRKMEELERELQRAKQG